MNAHFGAPGEPTPPRPKKSPKRNRLQQDFLPAALEVLEKPPRPMARVLALVIASLFLIAFGWAYFAKVDVVATGVGEVTPTSGIQEVQAAAAGTVAGISVRNGSFVKAGEVLLTLDSAAVKAEIARLRSLLSELKYKENRLADTIAWHDSGMSEPASIQTAQNEEAGLHLSQMNDEIASFVAQMRLVDAERDDLKKSLLSLEADMERLKLSIPLLQEREQSLRDLFDRSLVSKEAWLGAKLAAVEAANQLKIKQLEHDRIHSQLKSPDLKIWQMRTKEHARLLGALIDTKLNVAKTKADLFNLRTRLAFHFIRAPLAGTVQQLAIETIGATVQTGEKLLVIVPKDTAMEITAKILHRDAGLVRVGQPVAIKLEAYPFTKFGALAGRVANISRSSVSGPNGSSYFVATISITPPDPGTSQAAFEISSGMSATVDIKLGQRRIIEFLLSPLLRYRAEALREY